MSAISSHLTSARCLPADHEHALLVGRVWQPEVAGPSVVRVTGDGVFDLSALAPTISELLELPDPAAAIRASDAAPRIDEVSAPRFGWIVCGPNKRLSLL